MPVYPNDLLKTTYLIGAVNGRPSKEAIKQQYIGLSLLPWEKTEERQFTWDVMKSENNLAGIYDPRGRAIPGDEMLYNVMMGNLIDVKASRVLDSWASQELRDAGMPHIYKAGGNKGASMQRKLKEHINKRLAWCNEAVDSNIEYLALHALQGSIPWPPVDADGNAITNPMPHWNADMAFTVSMGLPSAQNQNASSLSGYGSEAGGGYAWTDHTNSDPIKDLEVIKRYMSKTFGVSLQGGTIYMSSIVLGHMTQCANILSWIAGVNKEQNDTRKYADQKELFDFIQTRTGWNIRTYDAQWTYRGNDPMKSPTVQRVEFLKEGKILILPAGGGAVGGMMTAPLESSPGGSWVYGKMGWKWQDGIPPFDITLGVNATAFPRFSHYDWFVLDTYS